MDSISISVTPHSLQRAATISGSTDEAREKLEPASGVSGKKDYSDKVTLSVKSKDLSGKTEASETEEPKKANDGPPVGNQTNQLDADELKEIQVLKARDTEVRAHEQAHLSAAGQYAAGGASFSYKEGPNGQRYAVGGEVPIDMSREATPEETILKMQVVKRAALAPANPSSADRRIAAQASATASQARREQLIEVSIDIEDASSHRSDFSENNNEQSQVDASKNNLSSSLNNDTSVSQNSRQMILNAYQVHST